MGAGDYADIQEAHISFDSYNKVFARHIGGKGAGKLGEAEV